jgi:hypothetical protein
MARDPTTTSTDATGTAVTVTETVALFPSLVAVIVAVPGATALISPAPETVAAAALLVDHSTVLSSAIPFASTVVALIVDVAPAMSDSEVGDTLTVATGAGGTGDTVIVALPDFSSLVATMFAVPAEIVVTSPVAETVAIAVLSELHTTTRSRAL